MEDLERAAKHYFGADYEKHKKEADQTRESMVEHYIGVAKIDIRKCKACSAILAGFYFCCIACENCDHYYSLCVNCFYDGTVKHDVGEQHDSFADNHSILAMVKKGGSKPTCKILKKPKGNGLQRPPPVQVPPTNKLDPGKGKQDSTNSRGSSNQTNLIPHGSSSSRNLTCSVSTPSNSKHVVSSPTDSSHSTSIVLVSNLRDSSRRSNPTFLPVGEFKIDKGGSIEKLAYIAQAHHDAAPVNIKKSADAFFRSMVKQNGNTVTMEDFVESMKEMRYPEYAYPELFEMLVKDKNVGMDKMESRTVYYIIVSGRPFCSSCKCFITDVYFCCSKCPARRYALCLHCYSAGAYIDHEHSTDDEGVFFLDYSVLHNTIKATPPASHPEESGSSQAIVERIPRGDDGVAKTFKVIRTILNTGATILTIASTLGCTIM